MMRARILTWALAGTVLGGEGAAARDRTPTSPLPRGLDLVWSDPWREMAGMEPLVREELAESLARAGLALRLTPWDGSPREPQPNEIHVLVCATPPPLLPPAAMGSAPAETSGARQVAVFVASIRRVLGLHRRTARPLLPGDRRQLARAVARVVLHELVHTGAPHPAHAPSGLMASALGRAALVGPALAITESMRHALHAAAGGVPPEADPGVRADAPEEHRQASGG
jgi:hypothetical protein